MILLTMKAEYKVVLTIIILMTFLCTFGTYRFMCTSGLAMSVQLTIKASSWVRVIGFDFYNFVTNFDDVG